MAWTAFFRGWWAASRGVASDAIVLSDRTTTGSFVISIKCATENQLTKALEPECRLAKSSASRFGVTLSRTIHSF